LDINSILAKNDPAATGNPIDVTRFGRNLGVTSGNWRGTNGSDPDFFLYEATSTTADIVDVQAILPGGVAGQTVPLFLTTDWGMTGLTRQGNPNAGQPLVGVAISVQELLDQNGSNLSATAELEGLRILSDTVDLGTVAAINPGILPLRISVNTSTGEVRIVNPNTTTYALGLNFYRVTSASNSLNNDTWNSLDEQEGADQPGEGWEVGGGSSSTGSVVGDYNQNGAVDAADYVVWRDTNINGAQGYADWRTNFGKTGGANSSTSQLLELRNEGLTEIAPNGSISLGQAFQVGGTMDLVFHYGVDDGLLVQGGTSTTGSGIGSSANTAVPEAASGVSALLACALCCLRRRSRAVGAKSQIEIAGAHLVCIVILAALANVLCISPAAAAIIAQEDFNYAPGPLAGNNGGTGWGGAWGTPGVGSLATVIDVSGNPLAFSPAGGSNLSGGATALQVQPDNPAANIPAGGRPLASPLQQTFYAGYLFRYDGDDFAGGNNTFSLHLSNSETNTTSINFGFRGLPTPGGNEMMVRSGTGAPVAGASGGGEVENGREYLLLAKLSWSGTNYDQAEVWIDPPTTPAAPDLTLSLGAGTGMSAISHVFFRQAANQQSDLYVADRLVLGTEVSDILGVSNPVPSVTIDRSTGSISLTNSFNTDLQVVNYSLTSATGGLNPSGWTPVTGRLDAPVNGGNGTFDPDSGWAVSSSSATSLAEAASSGNGGRLAMNGSVGLGNAWVRSPFQDVVFQFQLEGGAVSTGLVNYVGTPALFGDLNSSGAIDRGDFAILSQHSYSDLTGETTIGAYRKGDLDGDRDNDFDDFQEFRRAFDVANGAAAFEALLAELAVPEPGSALLIVHALLAFVCLKRGERVTNTAGRQR
jgi:hypothetical protein